MHVDLGALDVSLVAVVDRQGNRDPHRPRRPTLPAIRCIVLVGVRLIEQVSVLEAVGPLKLDIGFGDRDPQPIGRHVGTTVEREFDQLIVGRRRRARGPDRAAQLESLGLVGGQIQQFRQNSLPLAEVSSASSSPTTAISRSDLA